MSENKCYDPDCLDENCHKPEHFNYICFDPDCDDVHCENQSHFDKQLLRDFQEETDLSVFDHREEIDYDEDVDISICGCPDCADDHDHDHNHDHSHDHHHDHDHEHHHSHEHHDDDCCDDDCCSDDHHGHEHVHDHGHDHHHHHDHEHHHSHEHHDDDCCDDDCCSDDHHGHEHHSHESGNTCSDPDCDCHDHDHDDVNISICGCPDCADDDDHDHESEEELIAEGKPLISNRPIQIIVSSGILFGLGHILEWMSLSSQITNPIFMLSAIIAGYEIAILAYKSLVKRHTVGPAMLMVIACVASFIIGHPEEGAAVAFLYYIAEFLEDYAEHRAKHSIKSLVEIAPETAHVKVGDGEEERKIEDVNIGEIVIVRPGDKIPLDGNVVSGSSSVDQASITGESLPVLKELGDEVFSGTVNKDGYLEIVVNKLASLSFAFLETPRTS